MLFQGRYTKTKPGSYKEPISTRRGGGWLEGVLKKIQIYVFSGSARAELYRYIRKEHRGELATLQRFTRDFTL